MKPLTTYDLNMLDRACALIHEAHRDAGPYLVGTSAVGSEYRDVDVRLILTDPVFDSAYADNQPLWELHCLAITAWLRTQTGLPIDFQIQRMTEANEKHKGPRNPLGSGKRVFAGGGDATRFITRED